MLRRRITRWQPRLLNPLPRRHPRGRKAKLDLEQLDPNQVHLQSRRQGKTEGLLPHVQRQIQIRTATVSDRLPYSTIEVATLRFRSGLSV
jgi:hypothetical protein